MKSPNVDRRRFVTATGLFLAGTAVPGLWNHPSPAGAQEPEKRFKKALGWGMIGGNLSIEDKFRLVKDVGFEGVEMSFQGSKPGGLDPKEVARASEKVGVAIHGLSKGGHPDFQAAIDEAAIYGATSVLHVVPTDPNASYLENYRRAQEAIRAAIPHAEKRRVTILLENVWATFLIEPTSMARYVDELASPYVKAYFDVGNVMRWGWPQHWIEVLGKRIGKIHVKEYSLKTAMSKRMLKGFDFPMGEGDIDWPRVCRALADVGYRGWATAEVSGGDRQRLAQISAEMDRVLRDPEMGTRTS